MRQSGARGVAIDARGARVLGAVLSLRGQAHGDLDGGVLLADLGVDKLRLLTNNPRKRTGLAGYGLEVVETVTP